MQNLHLLPSLLSQSGIGGLPLTPSTTTLDPDAIMRDTVALYERLKRSQESAANVVNLLGTAPSEGSSR
jgi:hypothetical protein